MRHDCDWSPLEAGRKELQSFPWSRRVAQPEDVTAPGSMFVEATRRMISAAMSRGLGVFNGRLGIKIQAACLGID